MRLIQFYTSDKQRAVAIVNSADSVTVLHSVSSVYQLAQLALSNQLSLQQQSLALKSDTTLSYTDIIQQQRLLPPYDHPDDAAHMLITGTGLTHLGSADTRATMHAQTSGKADSELTDTMKMFKLGVEGGKPVAGQQGVQPEWFYKGDGSIVVAPGAALTSPAFALDGGEEPEIAGLYLIGPQGQPYRLGFAIGNEFSDHKTERQNYLYLAHSKLRPCSFGPELLVGELPADIRGHSRIIRNGETVWQKPFVSGEQNMSHSIANLEAHHFKYRQFCRPGDVHVHFFGTATLSFGDGFETKAGDVFEIGAAPFGQPLQNMLAVDNDASVQVKAL
ncbi:AraD1 family protein [Rheinheimera sp. EpRS3]|uniref:AraD1 family protein n=1 Tax=Rheinheimera sp. EpRS3 TaxID=1712383 RepID=UPI000746FD86|nr:AraD1 family protein [Rheinheimera sp. EpRS3]KUM53148.1 FAH family protein [Rheinheimera sp. EpRS3]